MTAGRTRKSAASAARGSPPGSATARATGGSRTVPLSTLIGALDRGEFPASLYLDGPSEPHKTVLLADLRHAWAAQHPDAPPPRVRRIAESGIDEILAAYQGGSLFAARELILVLEIEDLARSEKRVAAFAEAIARPSESACLVLVESESDTERKKLEPLRGACQLRLTCGAPTRPELLAWGGRRLRQKGIAAAPGVIEAVADACEGDALAFFSELARLTAFATPGAPLTRADADALLRPAVGAALPDYLAAVSAGDEALASRRLGRLLAAGENEGSILWALSNLVGGALGGWTRFRDLSPVLARRLGRARLTQAMDAMYRAEAAWKGGRADAIAVLEQATRVLARR